MLVATVMNSLHRLLLGQSLMDGEWLISFNMVIGMDEIFKIEARAIVEGMKLAWLKGYK
ncbi:hypothetical protein Goklo_023947 [Gossypium klotzschianum]|uniref:RNase H type-1 domain-containing protein n=1 Tax=Gossypium klotzschianum TaxID=34286 RepID=A0A7J8W5W8_9ROSI|nr:hypothetical protein [Gossypium klotzschianum]